jgi:predicted N-acetyltransferase YhbS
MDTIRHIVPDDVPGIASLFQRVFRGGQDSAPLSLQSYLKDLYFDSPWHDETISSLVCESAGKVVGFVGTFPFPYRLNGSRIMAVLAGNLMVDPDFRNSMIAVRLMKQLFSGPQDATLTDTATDLALKLWEKLGSVTIQQYSLQWFRLISPSRFALSTAVRGSRTLGPVEVLSRPLWSATDAMLRLPRSSPFHIEASGLQEEELSNEELLNGIQALSKGRSFIPDYDPSFLQWLITRAEEKQEFGKLRRVALYDRDHSLAGWYMYYPNRGKAGQVLQCVARPRAESEVLRHLLNDALAHGSLALIGRYDPQMVRELSLLNSVFTNRGSHVQAYSKKVELIRALQAGDAFFTRLEGEWWTRLQGDRFE